jgi:hypothetical protein
VGVEGEDAEPVAGKLDLFWGGLDINGSQYWQEYIRVHPAGYPTHVPRKVTEEDAVSIKDGTVNLSNPQVPLGAVAMARGTEAPERIDPARWREMNRVPREEEFRRMCVSDLRDEHRVAFSTEFDTAGEVEPVRFLAWKLEGETEPLSIEPFDAYLAEARSYYEELLEGIEIETPDTHLNAAFNSAVVNMDYGYEQPAWFEGVHEWNGYFSVNYQISAAICLGQLDRAREALLFFGERPRGPGGVYRPDGSLCSHNNPLDGMPYYVLQLYRYWRANGDDELMERVWEKTCDNFEEMLDKRDPDGDLLLNWHAGCNVFLYQADHLNLPGTAASPSIMATGMLEMMAQMAEAQGEADRAETWRRRAAYMRREIIRRLWLEKERRLTSGVDEQGLVQRAAYYTDFVFPILYSGLPREYGRRSLEALNETLWIGDHLLRTGNYRPDYFGNNAVHPTAMCEGAEAYFEAGRARRGWALLHGTALSATVLTDSPGAFPEYCTTTGYGLPDWIFGNDTGTYIRAVVGGLFGFERTEPDRLLAWRPTIPGQWESAQLRLDGVKISIEGRAGHRRYELELPAAQAVECRLPLFGRRVENIVDVDGQPIPHEEEDGFARLNLPASEHHVVNVRSSAADESESDSLEEQSAGPAFDITGSRTAARPAELPGKREPVDLTPWLNAERLTSINHGAPCVFDFSDDLEEDGRFSIGGTAFTVRPAGKNMVRVEVGHLVRSTEGFESLDYPDEVSFPIGEMASGVELLIGADCRCRLTDMEIGAVELLYADGYTEGVPLIYGENVDCSLLPFATGLTRRELSHDIVTEFPIAPGAFAVPADDTRVLESVEVRIIAADASAGILGMNLVRPLR